MINLKDVCYARLKTPDVSMAADFATRILGLQQVEGAPGERHFRSDDRAHTLSYVEGDAAESVIGFEVGDAADLDEAGAALEANGHEVRRGTRAEADARHVADFIAFTDAGGTAIEFAVAPELLGRRMVESRDAGLTGFSHVGLFSSDPERDEAFWTTVGNARVSDRIGAVPLMRISQIHHSIALIPAPKSGIQHINHQVRSVDDIMRSHSLLVQHGVPIVFGPGRHPTSGARFVYFEGPDGMIFEYSVGVDEVDEDTHRPRQFAFEPQSFCMWGAKPTAKELQAN